MKQTNERLCALAQKGDAAALDSLIDNNKSFIGKVANDLFRSMNALPGKTVAVVHFFQDRPFLLHFQKDLTGELIEGTAYVFEFETFEVELPDDEENPNISDYMYSINVTNYRVAEDDELGLEGKIPTVEIVSK